MKLLLCAPVYPPSVGGVQTLSYSLAGGLARRGNRIRVLARGWEEDADIDAETAPAEVTRVGWKPLLWPVFTRIFVAQRPDAVLLTHRADFLRPAFYARRMLGVPVAVVVHGNEVYGSRRRENLIVSLGRADAVIAVSHYVRGRLLEMGLRPEKTFAIPNGVSFSSFDRPEAGAAVRRELGLGGKKVILSVGRLTRVKGFDAVIRALPRVAERHPDVIYLIVGDGPEWGGLRALANELGVGERVLFLGEVPRSKLGRGPHAYYQACDVFAMPSREVAGTGAVEAFGIAHLEAGACGKPVIAGRSGGASEAVADGESGILVDADNSDDVESALRRLLASPDLARAMGEAGRKRAEARTWGTVSEQYEAVLKGLSSS